MKRWRNTAQMRGQTRNTDVQINEEEIVKPPEKKIQNNCSKDDQKPWKQNGENESIIKLSKWIKLSKLLNYY